ncbi:MAG: DUF1080 domain-containing protein [Bryobacteraceae bacterium]
MFRLVAFLALPAVLAAQLGYKDTPIIPGQPWHVHDPDRPHPRMVTPGEPGDPPSDAIVLFDGKDLSKWAQRGIGAEAGETVEPKWKVQTGYFGASAGDMFTGDKFGDAQIHIEWSEPTTVRGSSQGRGNSGVYIQSLFEIQVLDSYNNPTYADGASRRCLRAMAAHGQSRPQGGRVECLRHCF